MGISLGGGKSNSFQYSCLENPTDRGAWQAAVHGVAKSQARLSNLAGMQRGWAALTGLHPTSELRGPPDRLPISRGSTTHPDQLLKLGNARHPASQALTQPITTPPFPPTLSTQNLFLVFSPHGHQPLSSHLDGLLTRLPGSIPCQNKPGMQIGPLWKPSQDFMIAGLQIPSCSLPLSSVRSTLPRLIPASTPMLSCLTQSAPTVSSLFPRPRPLFPPQGPAHAVPSAYNTLPSIPPSLITFCKSFDLS